MLPHEAFNSGTRERRLPRQHLVQHTAEGIDITPPVQVLTASCLLGTHVLRGPHRNSGLREPLSARRIDRAGDPEVGDHRVLALEQNVLGLDVAVQHVVLMGEVQGIGHLGGDPQGLVERELSFLR